MKFDKTAKTREEFKADNAELRKENRRLLRENLDLQDKNDDVSCLKLEIDNLKLEIRDLEASYKQLNEEKLNLETKLEDDYLNENDVSYELRALENGIEELIQDVRRNLGI